MEDYNKIIESLNVRFIKAKNIKILQSLRIMNFYDVENTFIALNKGKIHYATGDKQSIVKAGDVLFIPGGKLTSITYGSEEPVNLTNEYFINNRWKYFQPILEPMADAPFDNFSYITLEAKVFNSVNFFSSLDIPPFVIEDNDKLKNIFREILAENISNKPGSDEAIKLHTIYLVIEVIRHIIDKKLFVEQLATNSTYFKDPRLIDIFNYIKENLGGNLSNKILASIARVSEDYVGQYFKVLTGINPQDYIEYQRMEEAIKLLRTTKKSIREIGKEVGFKDTAYFCRRFKMMFGIPAGKMRRRESLMDV